MGVLSVKEIKSWRLLKHLGDLYSGGINTRKLGYGTNFELNTKDAGSSRVAVEIECSAFFVATYEYGAGVSLCTFRFMLLVLLWKILHLKVDPLTEEELIATTMHAESQLYDAGLRTPATTNKATRIEARCHCLLVDVYLMLLPYVGPEFRFALYFTLMF